MYDTFLVPPLSAGNSTPVTSYMFKVKMDKARHGGSLGERSTFDMAIDMCPAGIG
jgi:hypothetical protein